MNMSSRIRKALIGAAAAGAVAALMAAPVAAEPQTYTSSDGILSIELPDESWKEMTDPANWIVLSDGSNTVTISHFANGEDLPERQIADDHYVNVYEGMFSSKNEVFLVTGALTDASKSQEVADMISSVKILKYDTKTAVKKETASASEFTITAADETMYSTASDLCVRTGCSTSETVIGTLGYGESVKVTGHVLRNGEDYGWVQVSYNGTTGYAYAGFLSSTQPQAAQQETSTNGDPVEMVQCEYCGQWLESGNIYRNHMCPQKEAALAAENGVANSELVQCEYCGEWLEAGNIFRNHMCPQKEAALAAEAGE